MALSTIKQTNIRSQPRRPPTRQEMSDWLIYLTVLHMIGRSKMNDRLHGMTPSGMLLDVSVSSKKKRRKRKKKNTTNIQCLSPRQRSCEGI